jgi:hypothetical protein
MRGELAGTGALITTGDERSLRVAGAIALSTGISLAVVLSSWAVETRLGVPQWWPWLLTGLQVMALWAAGARRWWGWLLGAAVQPPWIAYALLTGQLGFIPGCAVSAVVQTYSFVRCSIQRTEQRERIATRERSRSSVEEWPAAAAVR